MDALQQPGMFLNPASPHGENDNPRRAPHVSKACDQCRARKCKCDGKPEICYACRVSHLTCTWKGKDKRGGVPAEVEALRNRVQALERLCETLVAFFNINVADGGAHVPHPSSSIKTPETEHQSPLPPISTAPSSPVAGSSANLSPITGSFASPGMDDNFLTIPTVHRHQRSGSVTSADSGFIGWGPFPISQSATYPSSPYPAPSDYTTASYGPIGEPPQNVGYVIEQIANPEVIPVFVFYANGGEAADENPTPDSSMDDNMLFGHM